jgi:TonB-dependent starch-binding outer membrane protein SusC
MRKLYGLLTGLFMLVMQAAMAQDVTVSGKVTEANGTPVSNASVKEKGTKNGTTADAAGNFSLKVKSGATLVISSIGYEPKEVAVTGADLGSISLATDAKALAEVVVTGTGTATSKKKVAFAVESIGADKLPQAPTASIDQALVGKIAGAQISSIDGTPGARTNILLRGINSLQGGTRPLIVLDGIQLNGTDISQLDLQSVERIEVIQGAAAATIYGAQGANGVIQVFSKKGKQGNVAIDFTSSISANSYLNVGGLAKASKHGYPTDAQGNVKINPTSSTSSTLQSDGSYFGQIFWPRTILDPTIRVEKPYGTNLKYYDHFEQLFQTAYTYNNSLNISGASEKMDFAFGISNNKQESVIKKNGFVDRYNVTANIGVELAKGLRLRSITQLVYTNNTLNPFYTAGRNSIYEMLNINPFNDLNYKDPDGNYPFYLGTGATSVNGYNPNYYFQYVNGADKTLDVIQNLNLNYKINKFVELDAKYGINHQNNDVTWVMRNQSENISSNSTGDWASSNNSADNTGEIDKFNFKSTFQNFIASAFIRTDFQKDFNLNIPLATSTQVSWDYRKNVNEDFRTYGYSLPLYPIFNNNQAASTQVTRDRVTPFVTYGYLVNQRFDYGDYGGVSVGFRSDFSSAFGKGSEPQTFPRADGYVRLSSFDFWKNSLGNIVTEFKLRAAYGEAGIQPGAFDRYQTLSTANLGSSLVFVSPSAQNNADLQVELTKEIEFGFDLEMRPGKGDWFSYLKFSPTYWNRKSERVIFNVDVATSTGSGSLKDNAFTLASKGFQASLQLDVYKNKNFSWDMTINYSNQESKTESTKNGQPVILTVSAGSTNLALNPGDRVGQIYGFKAIRSLEATRNNGTPYFSAADKANFTISSDGYVVNKATKRIQFENESKPLTDGNPDFIINIINSINYQRYITFGFQIDWVQGAEIYNQTKQWMYRDGIHADYARPVTIDGETAAFASYYQSAYSDFFGSVNGARNSTKDYFVEDASFVRLRNISVGIDLAHFIKIKALRKVQVVFTGRNLWTATNYTGFDPEISSGTVNSAYERGIDHNSTPNNRSYQVSLNLGF